MSQFRFILTRVPVFLLAFLFLTILCAGCFLAFLREIASDLLTGIQNRMYDLNRWSSHAPQRKP